MVYLQHRHSHIPPKPTYRHDKHYGGHHISDHHSECSAKDHCGKEVKNGLGNQDRLITAKITAGIFFMSPIELTPIPMEQTPKIVVSSELILVGSLCPNKAPTTPPMATDRALMIIPTGIHLSPFKKGMCLGTFVRLAQLLATAYIFTRVTQTTAVQRSPCTAELTVRYLILAQSTVQCKHFTL